MHNSLTFLYSDLLQSAEIRSKKVLITKLFNSICNDSSSQMLCWRRQQERGKDILLRSGRTIHISLVHHLRKGWIKRIKCDISYSISYSSACFSSTDWAHFPTLNSLISRRETNNLTVLSTGVTRQRSLQVFWILSWMINTELVNQYTL